MIRTVLLGSCVSVQGNFVEALDDGRVVVQVDSRRFCGLPVGRTGAPSIPDGVGKTPKGPPERSSVSGWT